MRQHLFLWALLMLCGLGLAACETVKGLGQDLQDASRAVERKL